MLEVNTKQKLIKKINKKKKFRLKKIIKILAEKKCDKQCDTCFIRDEYS